MDIEVKIDEKYDNPKIVIYTNKILKSPFCSLFLIYYKYHIKKNIKKYLLNLKKDLKSMKMLVKNIKMN